MSATNDAPKGTRTIPLTHPIKTGKTEIAELVFGEMTLGVLEDIDIVIEGLGEDGAGTKIRLDLGHVPRLVANMTGIPYAQAKQITFVDGAKIAGEVMGFLDGFLGTGGK